jgi:biopolymer transport protein ExbB
VSNILGEALRKAGEPIPVIEKQAQAAGEREVVRLKKNLRVLSVITSVSPLLGLLGTITGMITAFQTVATSAEALGRTELLAKGIYEAMITTAAGLMVAIPTLIAYHGFSAKVDSLVHEIDRLVVGFVETLAPPPKPVGPCRAIMVMAETSRGQWGRRPCKFALAAAYRRNIT